MPTAGPCVGSRSVYTGPPLSPSRAVYVVQGSRVPG